MILTFEVLRLDNSSFITDCEIGTMQYLDPMGFVQLILTLCLKLLKSNLPYFDPFRIVELHLTFILDFDLNSKMF